MRGLTLASGFPVERLSQWDFIISRISEILDCRLIAVFDLHSFRISKCPMATTEGGFWWDPCWKTRQFGNFLGFPQRMTRRMCTCLRLRGSAERRILCWEEREREGGEPSNSSANHHLCPHFCPHLEMDVGSGWKMKFSVIFLRLGHCVTIRSPEWVLEIRFQPKWLFITLEVLEGTC